MYVSSLEAAGYYVAELPRTSGWTGVQRGAQAVQAYSLTLHSLLSVYVQHIHFRCRRTGYSVVKCKH